MLRTPYSLAESTSNESGSPSQNALPLLLGLLNFAAACIGIALTEGDGGIATLWPSNAILVAALLTVRYRSWPAFVACAFIASLAANLAFSKTPTWSLALSSINMVEAVSVGFLARRYCRSEAIFDNLADLGRYFAFAASVALICASIAAAAIADDAHSVPAVMRAWFAGDFLAYLVFTPIGVLAIRLVQGKAEFRLGKSWWEPIAVLLPVAGAATLVFAQTGLPLLFFPIPFLIAATYRLGPFGAACSTLIIGVVGTAFTLNGSGPVALLKGGTEFKVQFFQFYLAVVFITAAPLAALLATRRQLLVRVEESEQRHRGVVERSSEVIFETDAKGRYTFLNPAWADLIGGSVSESIGKSYLSPVLEEDREMVLKRLQELLTGEIDEYRQELRYRRKDGTVRWVAVRSRLIRDPHGSVQGYSGTLHDITPRKTAEAALAESERRYRRLAEHATDVVLRLDREGRCIYASPSALEISGFTPEELQVLDLAAMIHPDDQPGVRDAYKAVFTGAVETAVTQYRTPHKDGHWLWMESNLRADRDTSTGKVVGLIGSSRDIGVRKALECELLEAKNEAERLAAQMQELALTDELTGLANRRHFVSRLDEELKRASREHGPVSLAVLDIDFFKRVNDGHGHDAGDEVLRVVARVASSELRQIDLLGRLGGEEFGVLLPMSSIWSAQAVCERLRGAIESCSIVAGGASIRVTVSIGLAEAEFAERSASLLKRADAALYDAKASGRNRLILAA